MRVTFEDDGTLNLLPNDSVESFALRTWAQAWLKGWSLPTGAPTIEVESHPPADHKTIRIAPTLPTQVGPNPGASEAYKLLIDLLLDVFIIRSGKLYYAGTGNSKGFPRGVYGDERDDKLISYLQEGLRRRGDREFTG